LKTTFGLLFFYYYGQKITAYKSVKCANGVLATVTFRAVKFIKNILNLHTIAH